MNPEQKKRLIEAMSEGSERLTDEGMKKTIPLFVRGRTEHEDHKCGTCSMRIMPNGCTVVRGDIDMKDGVCSLWARGEASSPADAAQQKATKEAAGYEEYDGPINCESCAAYGHKDGKGHCRIWDGAVGHGDCCIIWHRK